MKIKIFIITSLLLLITGCSAIPEKVCISTEGATYQEGKLTGYFQFIKGDCPKTNSSEELPIIKHPEKDRGVQRS